MSSGDQNNCIYCACLGRIWVSCVCVFFFQTLRHSLLWKKKTGPKVVMMKLTLDLNHHRYFFVFSSIILILILI